MVGKKPHVIPLREVSRAAAKIMEAPYKLGSLDCGQGLDCISSIYVFYREIGAEIPDRFEDLDAGNYADAWREDPEKAKIAMMKYLLGLGEEIDPKFRQAGDLVFVEHESQTMIGIFLGNGHILASDFRIGTRVFPLRSLKGKIKRVQRLCLRD